MHQRYSLLILASIALTTACSDTTSPASNGSTLFSRQITFPDLTSTLLNVPSTGAARVVIDLPVTGLVAREVTVENGEQVNDPERVRSRITALTLNAAGDQGTLTLEPGFQVTFGMNTTFEAGGVDIAFQHFVDTVKAALAMSPQEFLGVAAERSPTNPLALGVSDAFPAAKLALRPGEHPKVKVNVTQANLVAAGSGDCTMAKLGITPQGCLEVLGETIGIGPETDLDEMNPGRIKAEFEGVVDCAKAIDATPDHASFFLQSGIEVLVDQAAVNDGAADDRDDHESRLTLDQVKTACGATPAPAIRAEGEGVLESSGSPATIRATEVKFEQEGPEVVEVELAGAIASIDPTAKTIKIGDHSIATDANTEFERADVTIAFTDLKVGDLVVVRGTLQSDGTILASEIRVRT